MAGYFVNFVLLFIQVLSYAIIGRVIMSWIDQPGTMRITTILRDITEPILAPLRSILPSMGGLDFTPIIAMLLLQALESLIVSAVGR
ncbi:MAG: YggT family protein [Chloroflexia bacterium]|nr:YggT family protein [Chloroflexia bacterium]